MSRLSDKEIMDLLIEEGLDKRIAENPEGAKQIARIVENAIHQRHPEEDFIENIDGRYPEAVKEVVKNGIGGIQINGDGSLSVNTTESKVDLNGDKERKGKTQEFSVGEDEDLVIDTRIDSITQNAGFYSAGQLFRTSTFNKNGLEMQISQSKRYASIDIDAIERESMQRNDGEGYRFAKKLRRILGNRFNGIQLKDIMSIFNATGERREAPEDYKKYISDSASEWNVTRNKDLVGAEMTLSEYDVAKNRDSGGESFWIGDQIYPAKKRRATIEAVGEHKELLSVPLGSSFEGYEQGKYEISKSRGYKAGWKNPAFMSTLLEQAKTDPELQKVVNSLELDKNLRTLTCEDYEKIYERVSDKDIKASMDKIREASKDDKETDKKRESDGNPEL